MYEVVLVTCLNIVSFLDCYHMQWFYLSGITTRFRLIHSLGCAMKNTSVISSLLVGLLGWLFIMVNCWMVSNAVHSFKLLYYFITLICDITISFTVIEGEWKMLHKLCDTLKQWQSYSIWACAQNGHVSYYGLFIFRMFTVACLPYLLHFSDCLQRYHLVPCKGIYEFVWFLSHKYAAFS